MSEPAAKQRPMIDLDEFERRLRRPAAAPQSQDDPLAELARLVGGQQDPFKSVFARDREAARAPQVAPAVPSSSSRAAPAPHYSPEDYADDDSRLHGTIHPQSYANEEAVVSGRTASHGALHAADDYAYPDGHTAPMMEAPLETQRSRRPLYIMAAIIAVGIAGISVSFAYKSKSGPHEIATIMALSGPTKVQPDSPGGVDVPNQDASILDKMPQPTPVGLVSHEEQPVDLSRQPTGAASPRIITADAGSYGAASVPVPVPPAGTQAPTQTGVQSYGIGALIEPKKVKTVSVRSDGTLLPNDTPPQMSPSVTSTQPPPQRQAVPPSATTPKPAALKSTARVVTTPKPAAPQSIEQLSADADSPPSPPATVPSKPKAASSKPIKVAEAEATDSAGDAAGKPGSEGAFSVQFAAPASEDEAHQLTSKLGAKYGSELSGHRLTYHRVKVNDKAVFRVRTGGLSKEGAMSICEKVKAGGGSCFVAKD